MTFVTTLRSAKMEFKRESYDCSNLDGTNDALCININFKLRFDIDTNSTV